MSTHLPFILIEVVLIFGGALAFAWWQFRDLRREREKREKRDAGERARQAQAKDDDAA